MPKGYPKAGTRTISPARRCAVCRHAERTRIETLRCAGVSLDKLAAQFDVKRDAIHRHMAKHVSDEAKAGYLIGAGKIQQLAEVAAESSESVLDYYAILRNAIFFYLDKAATAGDHDKVMSASARAIDVLKELGRVTGQVSQIAAATTINVQNNYQVINSAPFADLQSGLLEVCARHPEARSDIVALFRRLDEKYAVVPVPMKTIGPTSINGAPAHV